MDREREAKISYLHQRAEKLKKVGFVLTPLATGLTVWQATEGNALALVSGACAVVLAKNTVTNIRSERKLKKELKQGK